jgi:hypothetical protein
LFIQDTPLLSSVTLVKKVAKRPKLSPLGPFVICSVADPFSSCVSVPYSYYSESLMKSSAVTTLTRLGVDTRIAMGLQKRGLPVRRTGFICVPFTDCMIGSGGKTIMCPRELHANPNGMSFISRSDSET